MFRIIDDTPEQPAVPSVPSTISTSSNCNYATGLTHLFLCGASSWAIHETQFESTPYVFGTFVFLLGHSLIGVYKYTHPDAEEFINKIYKYSSLIALEMPLSLLNIQICINCNEPIQYTYSHAVSALIPVTGEFVIPEQNDRLSDVTVLGNISSLGYLSYAHVNYWAMGLAILTGCNHFLLNRVGDHFEIPKVDFKTIGLGFFTIFSVNIVKETIDS